MNSDFSSDQILSKELKKGNKKAFTFLFESYHSDLCTYIFSFTKNTKEAEDIVQNTMLKIWNQRQKINEKYSLKSYIYKIAYHQFINEYRKKKEKSDYFDEVRKNALDFIVEEDDEILHKKRQQILNEIQSLPEKCKEAFLLNKKHGLKYKEVAEELNISIKTVEIHISKALKRIKNKLKE